MKPLLALLILLAGCARVAPSGPSAASGPPATLPSDRRAAVDAAIGRGVQFLIHSQNPDGSWGTGLETRGLEIYSMVPGSHDAFRVGATALCVMALAEAGEKQAHDRGVQYLIDHGEARRDSGDLLYNTWAHLYAVQALASEARRNPDPRLIQAASWHLDRLARYETFVGGWNYYDFHIGTQRPAMEPTSFGTAAGLVALWEAQQAGLKLPPGMVDRALHRLAEMRLPNGAFLYSGDLKYIWYLPANQLRGSIGRTQAGNLALWLWNYGKFGSRQVIQGLEDFSREHDYIEMGRKRPYPHDSWYQTAPYYYYFGHYYAARLAEKLGGPEGQQTTVRLADWLLPLQEADGSWWDYAMWDYHKPYGTAFAMMTLLRCRS